LRIHSCEFISNSEREGVAVHAPADFVSETARHNGTASAILFGALHRRCPKRWLPFQEGADLPGFFGSRKCVSAHLHSDSARAWSSKARDAMPERVGDAMKLECELTLNETGVR
jgi:hypothetical protein